MQHEISDNLVIDGGELSTTIVSIGGKIIYGKGVADEIAYLKGVQDQPITIYRSAVGKALLVAIASVSGSKLYILPYIPQYYIGGDQCNAFASDPNPAMEGFFDFQADFWGGNIFIRYTPVDWVAGA